MVLHDQLVLEGLGRDLQDPLVEGLRVANAAINVVCWVGWSALAALRRPETVAATSAGRRAESEKRHTAVTWASREL